MTKPALLILSFSPIAGDARVLKQVRLFRDRYAVTTCGYGEAPEGVEHIRIPDGLSVTALNGRLITLRWYRRAFWSLPAVRWVRQALAGRRFDAVLANDLEAVPLALRVADGGRVHADLHEYAPRLHEEHAAWNRRIRPFAEWLARRYAARAASWTTVGAGLAREYERQFGFAPAVVTNAAPYADLQPGPVGDPIRLVHSGAGLGNRNLMTMVEGVELARREVTFDLYLTPNDPAYLDRIRRHAERSTRVRLHDPVPYDRLIATLNEYDVGVFVLPPVNFNYRWALPNKLFDYIQARLGIIVGPSEEMAHYVREHDLGAVADDFTAESLARAIDALDGDAVRRMKLASHAAAPVVSAEREVHGWETAIDRLLGAGSPS
ncbi:glycosyltransferase family 1 protein [Agromyces sp. C10]|uniref:glycosyltransferase family 1 protein n=1 Tax=Agromyces sp. C10 TaxID=2935077 RepID=UPI00200ABE2A|nr:glycosyltransferase family 1 protein [Agromyces sp. C10]MCK8608652.1 glycosyltransferase family 1 protein [Agromyces sp. C10]